eukprot:3795786-Rhodomonas_salina.1
MENTDQFVKLAQNGGKDMSELDKLYLNLSKQIKQHRDEKVRQKHETEANAKDAQFRLTGALQGVAK